MYPLNDDDFIVSSGFYKNTKLAIAALYEKADQECKHLGSERYKILQFQVISEVNQGSMMYCIVASFQYA